MSERLFETERMTIDKVGVSGGEGYLVCTPEHSLLYDTGFAYGAPAMVEELEALLDARPLDYIFLSHSHYDHASGSVWIKERWPSTVILGSAHAAHVFERPGARKVIRSLNESAVKQYCASDEDYLKLCEDLDYSPLDNLTVDKIVEEGDVIDLTNVHLRVIAAPGHTRCSLMLWCPEERLLLSSESIGVYVSDELVNPAFLTGYQDTLDTISKAEALKPEYILTNHRDLVQGERANLFLRNARYWANETARLVWEADAEGKSKDELLLLVKGLHYPPEVSNFQPEAAFDLNNAALVDQLLSCKPTA